MHVEPRARTCVGWTPEPSAPTSATNQPSACSFSVLQRFVCGNYTVSTVEMILLQQKHCNYCSHRRTGFGPLRMARLLFKRACWLERNRWFSCRKWPDDRPSKTKKKNSAVRRKHVLRINERFYLFGYARMQKFDAFMRMSPRLTNVRPWER